MISKILKEFDEKLMKRVDEYCDYSNEQTFRIIAEDIKDFLKSSLEKIQKESYDNGYFQGVKDETECIETNPEHSEAREKIQKEERLRAVEILHKYTLKTNSLEALDLIEKAQKEIL